MLSDIFVYLAIFVTILGSVSLLLLWANSSLKRTLSFVDILIKKDKESLNDQKRKEYLKKLAQYEYPRMLLVLKRVIDIFISAVALLLFLPNFLLVSLAIKIESHGPIFVKKRRMGLDGTLFLKYAFRTTRFDSKGNTELIFANITKVGAFLRKLSLDELPSLLNILFGDMSIVGRSLIMEDSFADKMLSPEEKAVLLKVKPGMVSLWSISPDWFDRNFERIVEFDLFYAANWSLWLDFQIVVRTIPATLGIWAKY